MGYGKNSPEKWGTEKNRKPKIESAYIIYRLGGVQQVKLGQGKWDSEMGHGNGVLKKYRKRKTEAPYFIYIWFCLVN